MASIGCRGKKSVLGNCNSRARCSSRALSTPPPTNTNCASGTLVAQIRAASRTVSSFWTIPIVPANTTLNRPAMPSSSCEIFISPGATQAGFVGPVVDHVDLLRRDAPLDQRLAKAGRKHHDVVHVGVDQSAPLRPAWQPAIGWLIIPVATTVSGQRS